MNKKLIAIVFLLIILFVTLATVLNPLRNSEERIREDLLKNIPIGTSMDNVLKYVDSKAGWEIAWIDNENGYGMDRYGEVSGEYDKEIGVKSIHAYIGEYGILFFKYMNVSAYFGFDKEAKLIDLAIGKETLE